MIQLFNKLKSKWGIKSNWDFLLINCVFALSGILVVEIRKPLFVLLGIGKETPFAIKFFTWLFIVFPTYQLGLITFGFLFGQFKFFWEKEKQMFAFLKHKVCRMKPAADKPPSKPPLEHVEH